MLYSAVDIARYIVTYCTEKRKPVSNLKLQKMLYYTWIDYYKETSRKLFLDEFCAWQLGPVVPDVYYEFCHYASTPISMTYPTCVCTSDIEILDRIIDRYIPRSASELVNLSHKKGGAWDEVYRDGSGYNHTIPYALIKRIECAS